MEKLPYKYKGNTTRPGNPLWNEFENTETGESSLREHQIKKIAGFEKHKHYFELLDANGNYQCRTCPMGGRIVWGPQFIKDGKIIKNVSYKPQEAMII